MFSLYIPLIYSYSVTYIALFTLTCLYLFILIYVLFILLYEFDKIDKNIEITTKLPRLQSVSSIDNDYLEAATGAVLKNIVNLLENTCVVLSF